MTDQDDKDITKEEYINGLLALDTVEGEAKVVGLITIILDEKDEEGKPIRQRTQAYRLCPSCEILCHRDGYNIVSTPQGELGQGDGCR